MRLLENSKPRGGRVEFKAASPTTSSSGPQQQAIAQSLTPIPSSHYISSLLSVSFDSNGNMTMSITSSDGAGLKDVNKLNIPISVKITLLNRDLYILSKYFTENPCLAELYNQLGPHEKSAKKKYLEGILSAVPAKSGQWIIQ